MKIINTLIAGLLCMTLAACGFKLRGYVPLTPELQTIYIDTQDLRLKGQLSRSLKGSKANIVSAPLKNAAILKIHRASMDRGIRSISGQGRIREYTLTYTVLFEVTYQGKTLLAKQQIQTRRDYSFSETEVLGKAVEENIISEELRREMIPRILSRIRSISEKRKQ